MKKKSLMSDYLIKNPVKLTFEKFLTIFKMKCGLLH